MRQDQKLSLCQPKQLIHTAGLLGFNRVLIVVHAQHGESAPTISSVAVPASHRRLRFRSPGTSEPDRNPHRP
jgi:hypothetical protein